MLICNCIKLNSTLIAYRTLYFSSAIWNQSWGGCFMICYQRDIRYLLMKFIALVNLYFLPVALIIKACGFAVKSHMGVHHYASQLNYTSMHSLLQWMISFFRNLKTVWLHIQLRTLL